MLLAAVTAGIVGWLQISDERDARKDAEREHAGLERRAQADEIAIWPAGTEGNSSAVLSNRSRQPVYGVVISRVSAQGYGVQTGQQIGESAPTPERRKEASRLEQREFSVLPPGEYWVKFGREYMAGPKALPPHYHSSGEPTGYEIAFQDQAGQSWVRYATGSLKEIQRTPIAFYGLGDPTGLSWGFPRKTR